MRSEINIPQNHIPSIKITWQKLDQKSYKKLHKKTKVLKSIENISTYFFYQFWTCKISQNSQKCIKKHLGFFWNFREKIKMHRGPSSKNQGVHSNKIQETEQRLTKAQANWPNPRGWWIRISRTHQGRRIDPDPIGPGSKGWEYGALDRVRTHPVQRFI